MDTTAVSRPTDGFVVTVSLQSEEDPGMPPEGSQCMDWYQEHGIPYSE